MGPGLIFLNELAFSNSLPIVGYLAHPNSGGRDLFHPQIGVPDFGGSTKEVYTP